MSVPMGVVEGRVHGGAGGEHDAVVGDGLSGARVVWTQFTEFLRQ